VKLTATPITAALAGIFSAVAWPPLWARYGDPGASGSVELILATLLVVALPAHAFVLGFNRSQAADARTLDTALLRRIGCWVVAGGVTVLAAMALRA
jgi:hypothetical protein